MIVLKNSIFYDIPKTGGSWVSEGLVAYMKGEFVLGSSHSPPGVFKEKEKECKGRLKFAFIRHPVEWYRSYYASRVASGQTEQVNFSEFLDYAFYEKPCFFNDKPWTTYGNYLKPFLKCDFIGRTEKLAVDLGKALDMAGEEYHPDRLLDRPKVNESTRTVSVDDIDIRLIEKKEKWIINKYYG